MKHYTTILIITIACLSFVSCKKSFLDVENNTSLYRQSFVKDLNSMEQFKNGIYVMLNNEYSNGIGAAYPEVAADNLKPLASGTQALIPHYSWSQQATDKSEYFTSETSTSMNGIWKAGYLIIKSCSFVIEDVDKYRNDNPEKSDDIKGQALAIRALVHFKLVNIFGQVYRFSTDASHPGVPYITTSDITKRFSRQTVAQVYDAMIDDLNKAIQLMPATVTDSRLMNQAAAKALLARIYLFKEDYQNAKSLATELCNLFPLLSIANGYPNDLFINKLPAQSEILYRLTPVTQPGITSSFLGARLRGTTLLFTATNDIAKILTENPNDVRRNWVQTIAGVWNVMKFPQGVTPELGLTSSLLQIAYYHPVIRSSEMFLTVAESSAKLNDENTARAYLNAIRKRANPSITDVSATGAALLDSIYKERRKELCFEELRMYDLQRWKLGVHRIDALTGMPKDLSFPSDKAISPIPVQDVSLAGLQQNKGY